MTNRLDNYHRRNQISRLYLKPKIALMTLAAVFLVACAGGEDDGSTPSDTPENEGADPVEEDANDQDQGQADFPSSPMEIIVPFSPGGGTDVIARTFASVAAKYVDVPVRVITMPGAGATLGAEYVANADPDGYTVIFSSDGSQVAAPILDDVGYSTEDFTAIAGITEVTGVVYVSSDSEFESMEDIVDFSLANPGELSVSTAGTGSATHVSAVRLEQHLGLDWTMVPFDGGADSLRAVLGGTVDFSLGGLGSVMPFFEEEQIRILAAMSPERDSLAPDLPTLRELGIDITLGTWRGLEAPAGTPDEIIDFWVSLSQQVVEDEDFETIVGALEPINLQLPEELTAAKEDLAEFLVAEAELFG